MFQRQAESLSEEFERRADKKRDDQDLLQQILNSERWPMKPDGGTPKLKRETNKYLTGERITNKEHRALLKFLHAAFMNDLVTLSKTIDGRNKKREHPFEAYNPKNLEVSINI